MWFWKFCSVLPRITDIQSRLLWDRGLLAPDGQFIADGIANIGGKINSTNKFHQSTPLL